jgi:zinc transport system substrate-binding protein
MKTWIIAVLLGIVAAAQAAPLTVRCSIPPLVSVVNAVGGERVQVQSLMSSAQDPHTWSPSPREVADARDADLLFTVGMPFEQAVAEKLAAMNPDLRLVNTAQGLERESDPHVWLSLTNLAVIAESIEQALAAADPDGAALYRSRRMVYQQMLQKKHEQLMLRLAPLRGTAFFVYHPVFGYFATDYGLSQGIVEIDGKSPSPKALLNLIHQAREKKVRAVFVQPQFSQRAAEIIAGRIGGKVVPINPLGDDPVAVLMQAAQELEAVYGDRP